MICCAQSVYNFSGLLSNLHIAIRKTIRVNRFHLAPLAKPTTGRRQDRLIYFIDSTATRAMAKRRACATSADLRFAGLPAAVRTSIKFITTQSMELFTFWQSAVPLRYEKPTNSGQRYCGGGSVSGPSAGDKSLRDLFARLPWFSAQCRLAQRVEVFAQLIVAMPRRFAFTPLVAY